MRRLRFRNVSLHRRMLQRGETMIELITTTLVLMLVGSALAVLVFESYDARGNVSGQGSATAWARRALDELADNIRNAQLYETSTSPATYEALEAGTATSATIYTDASGDYTQFWFDSTTDTLKKTTSGGSGTTTVLLEGVTALSYTYYVSGGNYNAAASSWVTTSNSHAPVSTELPNVDAVAITATVTQNGYARQLSALARIRDSPYH